ILWIALLLFGWAVLSPPNAASRSAALSASSQQAPASEPPPEADPDEQFSFSVEIEVVSASVDPATNITMSFLLPEDRQDEMTTDLCVVTVSPIDEETRPVIARFMTHLIEESDRPPWKLTHHIKFRLAVLLRLKVKLLWGYWQQTGSEP
ncbi:MAG: hypothetical protein IH933_10505, partial [Euryarchaeota archaeon]|nr:hypothetical protein [Euryarchaeota archaeon]